MRWPDRSAEREAGRSKWRRWFAWHPVYLDTREWAWLEVVERRQLWSGGWGGGYYYWEYRNG